MPNRIIREGIIDSEAVNSLSPEAEVFYRRLMSVVDDYGRFDGRLPVIRSRLYALQLEKVREASLERWIAECVKARLIRLYTHAGKPYLSFLKLGAPRAKGSKYPPPPDEDCAHENADANICAQTNASVPYSYSGSGTSSFAAGEPPKKASKPRERDELFDAIATVTHSDPGASASFIVKVKKALLSADPPYTPSEVFDFANRFRDLCTWARSSDRDHPELGELQKHIGKVRANGYHPTPPPRTKAVLDAPRAEPLFTPKESSA